MKPLNPPAFPSPTEPSVYGAWGMTLRDYFAASALSAIIWHTQKALDGEGEIMFFSNDDKGFPEGDSINIARYSYAIADAMLSVRSPTQPHPELTQQPPPYIDSALLGLLTDNGGSLSVESIRSHFKGQYKQSATERALRSIIKSGTARRVRVKDGWVISIVPDQNGGAA